MLKIKRIGLLTDSQCLSNSTVIQNLAQFNYIYFYNEVCAITDYVDAMANIIFKKRMILKDNDELNEIQKMIDTKDYSKYR